MAYGKGSRHSTPTTESTLIPLIQWTQLENIRLLSDRIFSNVYSAFLKFPSGHCVLVVLKMPILVRRVLWEARVLQALSGIKAVPRMYGVTACPSPNSALVMSYCPGRTLNNYQTADEAPVYLSALLFTCRTLRQMHKRGVTHGDIEPFNILVVAKNKKTAIYSFLVDFRQAKLGCSEEDKKEDAMMLFPLILDIGDVIKKSKQELYSRCESLFSLVNPSLLQIEVALESVVNRKVQESNTV